MTEGAGTPLARKLGIKEGSRVAFVGAPEGFDAVVGPLPAGAELRARARGPLDVVLLFVRRRVDLERRFARLARALDPAGGLWVVYPKKSSGVPGDLGFAAVQRVGLDAGLVDNKSAAVDDVWTGVRFVIRREDRP